MASAEDWAERYSRQILLQSIGGRGQHRLERGRVAIVGASSPVLPLLLYLGAAGVGTLSLIDYPPGSGDGAEAAVAMVRARNPAVKVRICPMPVTAGRSSPWEEPPWDLVVAMGSEQTIPSLNRICRSWQTPLLAAGCTAAGGWVAGSRSGPETVPDDPCLQCGFKPTSSTPPDPLASLTSGVLATILAGETLLALLGQETAVWRSRVHFQSRDSVFRNEPRLKDPHCPLCVGFAHVSVFH